MEVYRSGNIVQAVDKLQNSLKLPDFESSKQQSQLPAPAEPQSRNSRGFPPSLFIGLLRAIQGGESNFYIESCGVRVERQAPRKRYRF